MRYRESDPIGKQEGRRVAGLPVRCALQDGAITALRLAGRRRVRRARSRQVRSSCRRDGRNGGRGGVAVRDASEEEVHALQPRACGRVLPVRHVRARGPVPLRHVWREQAPLPSSRQEPCLLQERRPWARPLPFRRERRKERKPSSVS